MQTSLPILAAGLAVAFASIARAADEETKAPADAVAHRDIAYAQRPSGPVKLDVLTPPGEGPFPVVVWIHGGAWKVGDKAAWPHMNFLVGEGFAVANVGYRFSQVATYPAQLDDVTAALDYLTAHAAELKLDAARVAVTGESAGGHLASLLGLTRSAKAPATQPTQGRVRAVIDLFGPADFATMRPVPDAQGNNVIDELLGGPIATRGDLAKAASPLAQVSASAPPFLVLHGTKDALVPLDQSERFVAALKAAGASAELVTIAGAGHAGPAFWTDAMRGRMVAFLHAQLARR